MTRAKWLVVLLAGSSACAEQTAPDDASPRGGDLASPLPVQRVPAPLPGAHCDVQVDGVGVIDMEMDYLPHVITCENGGANLEALKAQAIAARSVAYYSIETSGSICDSQGCQVYSCGNEPNDLAYQAVMETSGLYLMYNSTLTYGFYVAGDNNTSPPSCVGVSGSTEGWVTYNEGRSGTDVIQTELGFVHDPADNGYGQNRGCMSQWGARCLENDNGYDYLDILRFYYGQDIEVQQAMGECVTEVDPSGGSSSGGATSEAGTQGPGGTFGEVGTESDVGPDPSGGEAGGGLPTVSAGGSGDDESDSAMGTGGGVSSQAALPENYGLSNDDGCACTSGGRSGAAGWSLALLGLLLGAPRARRRTARSR